ncbi:MAG: ribbon-helix-helix domain-containing protein [Alphaproteobacteria bacterium]|nr:ribbon-helix-helix domain-containing protein [Alphaproteobacteria bacterium]
MKKISVSLSGHQTSITLEPEFFDTLKQIATARGISVASIINELDRTRAPETNLSSAIRVWVLQQVLSGK